MGSRANIAVLQPKRSEEKREAVFLYGHWIGPEMANALQTALKKKWRWDDHSYLTRIIWDEVLLEHGTETGYGISTYLCDNNYPILVVDCERMLVGIINENDDDISVFRRQKTFEEFIALDDPQAFMLNAGDDDDDDE